MEPHQLLEHRISEWAGFPPECVVACSSGTAALHLALESFRLPLGSEVIVPDFTMVACPRAVEMAGLRPRFVDCDERLLIDGEEIHRRTCFSQESTPQVVMVVHVYGRKFNVDGVWACFSRSKAKLIEDLAEAHGVQPHPSTDAACWSFYRNKIVSGEEGGAVAFRDPDHARLARQLRSLGFTDDHDFRHVPRGHNYRLANSLASLIVADLDRFMGRSNPHGAKMSVADRRRRVEAQYDALCPREWRMPPRDAVWVYDFRVPGMASTQQDAAVRALQVAGIAARHAFKPMRKQEEWEKDWGGGFEWESDRAAREVIYLPISTTGEVRENAFEIVKRAIG